MSLSQWLPRIHHDIGWFGRFIISIYVAAALNFGSVFAELIKAASAERHVVDGFEIIVCVFGPPVPFYPRLFVLAGMFIAALGVFRPTSAGNAVVVGGLAGALSMYLSWWSLSYRVFSHLSDNFLDSDEIRQVAYLYHGTSFDIWIALSIFASLVLSLDRLFNHNH